MMTPVTLALCSHTDKMSIINGFISTVAATVIIMLTVFNQAFTQYPPTLLYWKQILTCASGSRSDSTLLTRFPKRDVFTHLLLLCNLRGQYQYTSVAAAACPCPQETVAHCRGAPTWFLPSFYLQRENTDNWCSVRNIRHGRDKINICACSMLAAHGTLHGHDNISDDDPFNRFNSIEDSCLRSLWSSQKLVFCFTTNPSTSCQGRGLFKRICKRLIPQCPSATPLWTGCSWGGQGATCPWMLKHQSLPAGHSFWKLSLLT